MYVRRFTCLTSCKDNTMNGQNGQAVMQRKRGNLCMMCSSQQKLDTVFKIMYQRTASIGQHMLSNLTRGIVPVSDSSASTPGAVR